MATDAGLDAVRAHIAGTDFYLLPETISPDGARELAERLEALRDTDATLRLRPRTAPESAPWTDPAADRELGVEDADRSDDEQPGTAWRDVPGEAIGEVEVQLLDEPVALWHWAIEREPGSAAEPSGLG